MLGRLARWLRIVGHDVAYGSHLHGAGLARCARDEGRMILTRDTQLVRDPNLPPHLFIASDHFREQLRQVAAAVPLAQGASFTRCVECNRPLEETSREAARERVPAYVFETQPRFWTCPACRRVFWPATHHARMRAELGTLGIGGLA
ncbi:MAG: Mut7-C RNAse domain-containing protein [Candidatus Binatia bacterium]